MFNIRNVAIAAAVMAAGPLAVAPAAAEELSLAHWVPPAHTITATIVDPLSNSVSDATGGELTVRTYPGGELGAGPLEQYVRVVQGVADIAWGLQGYTSTQFPKTMIAELPGAIPDGDPGYPGLWAAYDLIADEYPATKPLALYTSEPNIFIMKDIDINTPADVAGLKIRVSGAAAGAVIEALGATPVQMPAGEIYNSLQTGLIDGVVTGASAVADFKLDEVANSYTIGVPLGRITFFLVMNQARYDGLSAEHQAAIDAVAGEFLSKSAEDGWNQKATDTIAALKATGDNTVIELTADQAAPFADITVPVTDAIVSDLGAQNVLDAMRGN